MKVGSESRGKTAMSTNRATAAIKKTGDSTTTGRARSAKANKAKTNDAPGSEKPAAQAPGEKTPVRLTEKGRLLMKELGIDDIDLLMGLWQQIHNASRKGAEVDTMEAAFTLAFVKGGKPRDPIESALETQMSVTHQQLMRIANRLNNAETEFEFKLYEPIFTRLARTYVSQVDALKRYRSKDEPGLTVQTVSVQDGGQAIVGHITHQASNGGPPEIPAAPLAITDAKLMPLPSLGNRRPERVPRVPLKKYG
jgi:hypothetical protein